ncbi:MAG TPA: high-potential iron-sulfur protein [Sulfuricaulis sp.]|nr:high-potential iron-sulfur protein [Sulfuricaulis sp.]
MSTYNSERRTVLRGVALLALTVAGCQKKDEAPARQAPAPEAAAPATPAPGAGGAPQGGPAEGAPSSGSTPQQGATAQGGKLSKAQAQYQEQPKGDQNCANCMHFIAGSSTCQVVEGKVSPNGWCMLWAKKT